MSCSPARLAANRQNALKSTGPKSPEGKAATRLNAFKHGMAGQGDLPSPGDDLALVAKRSIAFARECDAKGDVGWLLARRAALLSVRMERMADQNMRAVAANAEQALADFDSESAAEVDRLIADLQGEADPKASIAALEETPDGVARLIDAWSGLRGDLGRDVDRSSQAQDRAKRWFGPAVAGAESATVADLAVKVDAEVARLERLLDSMGDLVEAIDRARTDAGTRARFDSSPEATLARRYEAAAERGMYRAMKAIAESNRASGRGPTDSRSTEPLPQLRLPVIPPELLNFLDAQDPAPLASFRASVSPTSKPSADPAKPPVSSPEDRKKRPDLKRAARKLALARR